MKHTSPSTVVFNVIANHVQSLATRGMLSLLACLGVAHAAEASLAFGDARDTTGGATGISQVRLPQFNTNELVRSQHKSEGMPTTLKATVYQGEVHMQGKHQQPNQQALPLIKEGLTLGGETASPIKKVVFSLNHSQVQNETVQLHISSMTGLHTVQGFYQHQAHSTANGLASPTQLKVNGQLLQSFTIDNQEAVVLEIPTSLLKKNGFNTLQFEAGYTLDANNKVAYEAIQVGALSLLF